jgi:flagellar hook-associated protein 3 FlgL
MAWMEVTEASFMNVTRNLMTQLKELLVVSANGTLEYPDKMANIAAMRELVSQMGLDMNQTYAGRYVFSGFRTDQPPIFIENNTKSFVITQTFNVRDIEKTMSFQKAGTTAEGVSHPINVMKLAYKNLDAPPTIPGYHVAIKNFNEDDAYLPPAMSAGTPPLPVIHYIPQTGELVMHRDTANSFQDGTSVTYQKTNFLKGEPNPIVYFPVREITDAAAPVDGNTYRITQTLAPIETAVGEYTFTLAYSNMHGMGAAEEFRPLFPPGITLVVGPTLPGVLAPNTVYLNNATGTLTMNETVAAQLTNAPFSYSIETGAGDLSPAMNTAVQSVAIQLVAMGNEDPNRQYTMDGQEIQYEFATNTYVTINSLAKNVFTDKMIADFNRLFEFADSLELSDEKSLIEFFRLQPTFLTPPLPERTQEQAAQMATEQLIKEKAQINAVLHDRFNNMLNLLERHSANAMKEHTQMGSRMYRLELMQIRLEEDEAAYTKLMSENEDTDMARAIMLKAAAEAAYAASLRASANLVQLSLANFIG